MTREAPDRTSLPRPREMPSFYIFTVAAALQAAVWIPPYAAALWAGVNLAFAYYFNRTARSLKRAPLREQASSDARHRAKIAVLSFAYAVCHTSLAILVARAGGYSATIMACTLVGGVVLGSINLFVRSRILGWGAIAGIAAVLGMGVPWMMIDPAGSTAADTWLRMGAALVSVAFFFAFAIQLGFDRRKAEHRIAKLLIRSEASEREAISANEIKTAFLALVSHEVRTPLNGIMGMAQAMAMDDLPRAQVGRLEVIRNSGETVLTLLNDLLDLAKIEAGKFDIESIEFDLGKLLAETAAIYGPLAENKGVEFRLEVADNVAGIYAGDPVRIRQILNNLTSNALKFTKAGHVALSADVVDGRLRLRVTDTGKGIAPEHRGGLFQRFSQLGASTAREFGGTGLGLSICMELATLMRGEIFVESELGAGSSFTTILPLAKVSEEGRMGIGEAAKAVEAAESDEAIHPAGDMRILAADDNETGRIVLATLLEHMGVTPTFATNGFEAVNAWQAEDFDLILMDVRMPGMDGVSATRRIREEEAASGRPRVSIVALTGDAMEHQVASYKEAGMDAWISKPIRIEELFDTISRLQRAA